MADEGSGLRRLADRIANTGSWDGPIAMGNTLVWFARLPHDGGRQEVGRMELTEDRLTVTDSRSFALRSTTASALGRYRLTDASLLPAPRDTTAPMESVVTFAANDQITVDGPATHLLLLLLAHGLLE